jgi:hypothetical protein
MVNSDRHGSNPGRRQAGYFCHMKLDEKHTGAILVTNQIGVPLEFKYTEPVVITKLHRILYGSSLERYLHETLIRDRLSRELRSEPEFFLAPYEEKEFLGPLAGKEMVALQRLKPGQGDASGPFTRIRDREVIVELVDGMGLRLAFSTSDDAVQHYVVAWLQEMGRTMDILEPMDRVANALRSLCGEEKKI